MATKEDYKLDSLPYYDKEIDSDPRAFTILSSASANCAAELRDAAAKLVLEETNRSAGRDLSGELGEDMSANFLAVSWFG